MGLIQCALACKGSATPAGNIDPISPHIIFPFQGHCSAPLGIHVWPFLHHVHYKSDTTTIGLGL